MISVVPDWGWLVWVVGSLTAVAVGFIGWLIRK